MVIGARVKSPLPEKLWPVDDGATVVVARTVVVLGMALRAQTLVWWTVLQWPGLSQMVVTAYAPAPPAARSASKRTARRVACLTAALLAAGSIRSSVVGTHLVERRPGLVVHALSSLLDIFRRIDGLRLRLLGRRVLHRGLRRCFLHDGLGRARLGELRAQLLGAAVGFGRLRGR